MGKSINIDSITYCLGENQKTELNGSKNFEEKFNFIQEDLRRDEFQSCIMSQSLLYECPDRLSYEPKILSGYDRKHVVRSLFPKWAHIKKWIFDRHHRRLSFKLPESWAQRENRQFMHQKAVKSCDSSRNERGHLLNIDKWWQQRLLLCLCNHCDIVAITNQIGINPTPFGYSPILSNPFRLNSAIIHIILELWKHFWNFWIVLKLSEFMNQNYDPECETRGNEWNQKRTPILLRSHTNIFWRQISTYINLNAYQWITFSKTNGLFDLWFSHENENLANDFICYCTMQRGPKHRKYARIDFSMMSPEVRKSLENIAIKQEIEQKEHKRSSIRRSATNHCQDSLFAHEMIAHRSSTLSIAVLAIPAATENQQLPLSISTRVPNDCTNDKFDVSPESLDEWNTWDIWDTDDTYDTWDTCDTWDTWDMWNKRSNDKPYS
jgi:hypothetical protein